MDFVRSYGWHTLYTRGVGILYLESNENDNLVPAASFAFRPGPGGEMGG